MGSIYIPAQTSHSGLRIIYRQIVNGQEANRGGNQVLDASQQVSEARFEHTGQPPLLKTTKEKEILDFKNHTAYQTARISGGSAFHIRTPFSEFPPLTLTGQKDTILGYECEIVSTSLRSNSIQIRFTRAMPYRGTPQMAYGIPDGLVLKIVRNNNFGIVADTVIQLKDKELPIVPSDMGENVNPELYRHRITESLARTVQRNLVDAAGNVVLTFDGTYTRNAASFGNWGTKSAQNQISFFSGTIPRLSQQFRGSASKKIFFAPWETYFLLAEGAVRGWTTPVNGKTAYENGIKASFDYWGVSSFVAQYL